MKRLTPEVQTMLEQKIIPFWLSLKDERYGGFISYVDLDLRRYAKAEKGCILNSRILWFFSEAAMLLHTPELSHAADHAYRFLMRYCVDRKAGGVFWSVTYDGKLLDTTKHTYNQAFAIYALSAYYRLTGNPEALQTARQLFQIVEMHCRDAEGYGESYDRFWNPQSNEKLSENGVMAERTMNTLLHVFEGYSGLYQAAKSPEVEKELRALLDIETPDKTAVCVLADKEEIGSMGVTGMQSAAFDAFMSDLCDGQNVPLKACFENAFCLSADVTAAYDPNFADVYEKKNAAFVNYGVGICKYTGARGKSGSSDANAETVAYVRAVLDGAGVRWQICELGKIDAGGGGTVAQYMANRNIATLDAGVPVLSMHAPFEVVAKEDCYEMYRACKAQYEAR